MGRRQFTPEFKTKIVVELLREEKPLGELLDVNRTSFYYTPVEPDGERETVIKNRIDF